MDEQPYRHYWRVLYPECAEPKSTAHWYGKWKTAGMCMGLFGERQQARHEWIATGPRRGREEAHATAVVTYHASPVWSLTVKVCLELPVDFEDLRRSTQRITGDGRKSEHPHWRCPRSGIVIHWAGANSHKNRCKVVQGLKGGWTLHEGPSEFTVIPAQTFERLVSSL